jgi:hypothetical protein
MTRRQRVTHWGALGGKVAVGAVGILGFIVAALTYRDQHTPHVVALTASMPETYWLVNWQKGPSSLELSIVTVTLTNDASAPAAVEGADLLIDNRRYATAVGYVLDAMRLASRFAFAAAGGPNVPVSLPGQLKLPIELPSREDVTRVLVFQTPPELPPRGTVTRPPLDVRGYETSRADTPPPVTLVLHLSGGRSARSTVAIDEPPNREAGAWTWATVCGKARPARLDLVRNSEPPPSRPHDLTVKLWALDRRAGPIRVTRPVPRFFSPDVKVGPIEIPLAGLTAGRYTWRAYVAGQEVAEGNFRMRHRSGCRDGLF